ncbi:MAG TPA: hypothetical protein VF055_06845, partial [Steroidobacteraceae bacterium]
FTRWSTAIRRAVAAIGRVRSVRERRRLGLAALLGLALVGQLGLGPLAEALPCEAVMADCPHMTATLRLADGHSPRTDAPGPDLPIDCLMDLAGACSGVHAPANATAVMSALSPVPSTLEACEPSLPPLDDPPFELLRPPKL